tara:strand:+ start:9465 stop:9668 length:204 start_codon:yes stop_codon:yes gene_type:complete
MAEKKRARTKKGHYIADDPKTPENEAWVKPSVKQEGKFSYGLNAKKDFPSPGTPKYKMMVLSGEIKE